MTLDAVRAAEKAVARMRCAEHPDARLRLSSAAFGSVPWCGECRGPVQQATQVESLTSQYMQGEPLPAAIHSQMARKHGEWQMGLDEQTRAVILREPEARDIAAVIQRFEVAQPDVRSLALPEQIKVAQLVAAYDIQPFHVHIQEYKGQKGTTYSMSLTFEGRLYCAKNPRSMGESLVAVKARAMTPDERRDNLIPDGQCAAIGSVHRLIGNQVIEVATGVGRAGVGKDDQGRGRPIAMANPQELADTRAKRRALAEAAPLGIHIGVLTPSGQADDDDDVIDIEGRVVNTQTGEIKGRIAAPQGDTSGFAPSSDVEKPEVPRPQIEAPDLDPVPEGDPTPDRDEIMQLVRALGIPREELAEAVVVVGLAEQRQRGYSPAQIAEMVRQVADPPPVEEEQESLPW